MQMNALVQTTQSQVPQMYVVCEYWQLKVYTYAALVTKTRLVWMCNNNEKAMIKYCQLTTVTMV